MKNKYLIQWTAFKCRDEHHWDEPCVHVGNFTDEELTKLIQNKHNLNVTHIIEISEISEISDIPSDKDIHQEAFRRQEENNKLAGGVFEYNMSDFKDGAKWARNMIKGTEEESKRGECIACPLCEGIGKLE